MTGSTASSSVASGGNCKAAARIGIGRSFAASMKPRSALLIISSRIGKASARRIANSYSAASSPDFSSSSTSVNGCRRSPTTTNPSSKATSITDRSRLRQRKRRLICVSNFGSSGRPSMTRLSSAAISSLKREMSGSRLGTRTSISLRENGASASGLAHLIPMICVRRIFRTRSTIWCLRRSPAGVSK